MSKFPVNRGPKQQLPLPTPHPPHTRSKIHHDAEGGLSILDNKTNQLSREGHLPISFLGNCIVCPHILSCLGEMKATRQTP